MRIALLEDDPSQSDLVRFWLSGAGHICHAFERSREFMRALTRDSFDILVLDWELPDVNGDEVLAWLRANGHDSVPVLFTTARDSEDDIVAALKAGADDYLIKPLRKQELLARIDALVRRAGRPAAPGSGLKVAEFEIDIDRRVITRNGARVDLTQKDFDLAAFLFRNVGNLVSRGHILESVWGRSPDLNTRTVDTHVSRLRTKLGLLPENGWRLSAVYQHGYRLERLAAEDAETARPSETPPKSAGSRAPHAR
ncbi:MAG: response regulator transcription factor [Burkholderiales bacterium]|nr:response regulator transcription factor [Burkholderiales bacterium]